MIWDIVFPRNNEQEFALLAKKLGYTGLVCCYSKIPEKIPKTVLPLVCIDMNKPKGALRILPASDKTRAMIEMKQADLIFDFEATGKKEYIHHRGSGMNHVLAHLMEKKSIALGFAFSTLLHADLLKRAQLIGRMHQNIMLCRKYHVPMITASFAGRPYELRSPHDLAALFSDVGMHPKEITTGWDWLTKKVTTFK